MNNSITKFDLGASYNEQNNCVDFKLFSKNAIRIVLSIFENDRDTEPLANFELSKARGENTDIWQTSVKKYALFNLNKPFYYAYRVYGNASWFNSEKFAYDPYSLELVYKKGSEDFNAKSVFFIPETTEVKKLAPRPFKDEIIAEVHLKDLTINTDIVENGTFKGAGKAAKMLKSFGVTMIEFLPLNEFDDKYVGGNYWGYMPMSYFALNKKYAYDKEKHGAVVEFQEMINEFHENGIKVCMDVVYNHSAVNASFKLIDNKSYYKIDEHGNYSDNSCCKNDLNTANYAFQNLVADSVAYFAKLGVDAFRFDLAAALLDTSEGFYAEYDGEKSLAYKLPKMLAERGVKICAACEDGKEGIHLIAEPWTCAGKNAYQIGNFSSDWWEWNDVSRNTIRANSLRPNQCDPLGLKNLIEGSPQIFNNKESRSVNYVACHDGLTLNDLNSYYVEGWEISGDHYGDLDAQKNSIKKQIALLMLSTGVPLLQVGDLIAHTKQGIHNSYNLDSAINYLDFSLLNKDDGSEREKIVFDFWMMMIDLRCQLKPQDMVRNYYNEFGEEISPDDSEYWHNNNANFFAFKGVNLNNCSSIYVAISKNDSEIEFILPENSQNKTWKLYCDCSKELQGEASVKTNEQKNIKDYNLAPYSLVIFVEK